MNEAVSKKQTGGSKAVRTLCEGAIMVALAAVLSFLSLRLWPNGGSVDLVMVPLIIFALRRGAGWGIGACFVYGFIDCLLSGGVGYGWAAILLDYVVAYSVVGLAGLTPKKPVLAVVIGSAARLIVHILSGVIIWGQWMPEEFLGLTMSNIWVYSTLYNGSFMVVNCIAAAVVVAVIAKKTKLLDPEAT